MRLTRISVAVVTDESGAAVVYTPALNGMVRSVRYIKPAEGGLDGGSDIDIETDKAPGIITKSIFCLLTAVAETLTACDLPVTNRCLGWRSLRQRNGIKQLPDDTFCSLLAACKS